jgi:asparagine synthase (glutamine-hydrolysing)
MCGIAGFCDFNKKSSPEVLNRMSDSLHHRGPDSAGTVFKEMEWGTLGWGHRRLSIMDVSSLGSQPMYSKNGRWLIIFNGEIYNFKSIKAELINAGYSFISNSDTEVILEAFDKWGLEAIQKFIGMFAFALYDQKEEKVYLFRDRAGVKPLYYYFNNGVFVFASEPKAILLHPSFKKEINGRAINNFFYYGYIIGNDSIYTEVQKLPPGHFLKLDLRNRATETTSYWRVEKYYSLPKLKISENEAIENIKDLLSSACEYRLVSDVPVGIFLSGGYDSTCITALLQKNRSAKLKTFTIGFEEKGYNEAIYAKEIANYLGTDHHEYYLTEKECLDLINKIPDIYDEPFGDDSCIPTVLLSQNSRKHVSVALSADGGDEVFAGYEKYQLALKYKNAVSTMPKMLANVVKNIPLDKCISSATDFNRRYNHLRHFVNDNRIGNVLDHLSRTFDYGSLNKLLLNESPRLDSNFIESSDILNDLDKMLCLDYNTYLPGDILFKVDKATMSVGLEGREPLLDHRLVEFLAQIPTTMKIRNGEKKHLLKQIVHGLVPQKMVDRPKKGFSMPVVEWLSKDLHYLVVDLLDENHIKQQGIFNWETVKEIRSLFKRDPKVVGHKLWLLVMFQLWYKRWMNG